MERVDMKRVRGGERGGLEESERGGHEESERW